MISKLNVFSSQFWEWSVRPTQCTLGAGIISLKRYSDSFSDVRSNEFEDLKAVVSITECTLKATFEYEKINYLMLMMVDPHIHFHVVPRYSGSINRFEQTWSDLGWPKVPVLSGNPTKEETLLKIKNVLRENLPQ